MTATWLERGTKPFIMVSMFAAAALMVTTAIEMTDLGVTPDLLVGGAALSRNFTGKRIAAAYGGNVLYAEDAMDGLRLVNELRADARRPDAPEPGAAPTAEIEKAASGDRAQNTAA